MKNKKIDLNVKTGVKAAWSFDPPPSPGDEYPIDNYDELIRKLRERYLDRNYLPIEEPIAGLFVDPVKKPSQITRPMLA